MISLYMIPQFMKHKSSYFTANELLSKLKHNEINEILFLSWCILHGKKPRIANIIVFNTLCNSLTLEVKTLGHTKLYSAHPKTF